MFPTVFPGATGKQHIPVPFLVLVTQNLALFLLLHSKTAVLLNPMTARSDSRRALGFTAKFESSSFAAAR
jgi:hypothetical protein